MTTEQEREKEPRPQVNMNTYYQVPSAEWLIEITKNLPEGTIAKLGIVDDNDNLIPLTRALVQDARDAQREAEIRIDELEKFQSLEMYKEKAHPKLQRILATRTQQLNERLPSPKPGEK